MQIVAALAAGRLISVSAAACGYFIAEKISAYREVSEDKDH